MRKVLLTAMAAAAITTATGANATVTINITQVGSMVTATGTGTLDLTGMVKGATSAAAAAYIQPSRAALFAGTAAPGPLAAWTGFTSAPANFGTGTAPVAPIITGGAFFGLTNDLTGAPALVLLDSFASGGSVRFLAAWADQSFASLGVAPGSYTYALPSDRIVINVTQAVPEPASWAMMILGMGMVGHALRRRRQGAPAFA